MRHRPRTGPAPFDRRSTEYRPTDQEPVRRRTHRDTQRDPKRIPLWIGQLRGVDIERANQALHP
ncbi:hypothetical protein [Nocardia rhizosphaerihabitans]|uniref:Uncharacterized protein n=1 Tax=Nocardia rhizosphaerihabitans TaxID=1691570 RepID=A0ABQ2KGK7_9NOCA|nr:hypothetical protein [Nocardia rhizosphaerihabitans]GGN81197.1 hypothetical protein GCM10011610_31370 [Nocardia rhizosphaerihabitans]